MFSGLRQRVLQRTAISASISAKPSAVTRFGAGEIGRSGRSSTSSVSLTKSAAHGLNLVREGALRQAWIEQNLSDRPALSAKASIPSLSRESSRIPVCRCGGDAIQRDAPDSEKPADNGRSLHRDQARTRRPARTPSGGTAYESEKPLATEPMFKEIAGDAASRVIRAASTAHFL